MAMTPKFQRNPSECVFAEGGEMGALMRSHDWSQSPLGTVETWPQSLKAGIRIILGSRYPMFIWWGNDLINFYNDAYIPILGKRHPKALGESARDIWSELWHSIGPFAEEVLNNGNPSWNEEFPEIMERNDYKEETYFTFSYSPIIQDDDQVGGIFCACTEDTRRVVDDRRLRTLRELRAETAHAKTVGEACELATRVLAHNLKDIPFALIYLLNTTDQQAQLVSTTNLDAGTAASPTVIELTDPASDCWLLNSVLAKGEHQVIEQLTERFGPLPGGAWDESPQRAIALPLVLPGQRTLGILIMGISPYRSLDEDYQGFFELVAGQISTAIANASSYEEERKQADALAELDRAKIAFFSNVSHDFRTPLTLMLGPLEEAIADLETLERESVGALERESAEDTSTLQRSNAPMHQRTNLPTSQLRLAYRNSQRLLKLVNALLDFSRIESDRIQALYEPTDLATFTAELASVFRSAIEQAHLNLVVDCPPLPEPIYVDREMWEKIVLNILSNSFKFTFTGEIVVSLKASGDMPPSPQFWGNRAAQSPPELGDLGGIKACSIQPSVILEVRDTGIGIPAAELPRLFERFYRVKGAHGRTFEGSGIGLSLVQELVKLHGGRVEVSSVEGEGSCFRVFIPTGHEHLPAEHVSPSSTLTSPVTGAMPYLEEALRWLPEQEGRESDVGEMDDILPTPPKALPLAAPHLRTSASSRILLVDDNADMRDYLKRLLSQRWQVETAVNGAIALQRIQQSPPDLVLSDVMMPELNGVELLQALRENPATQSIPVILLSARAGEEATVAGLTAGADDYLVKPFAARELVARVQTQLQMSQLRQERSTNRFKNEFLLTLTHELQAPLTMILGWVRLLQSKSLDATTTARALATIERNATIEAKLVNDLLEVSMILAGNVRLKSHLVDLTALMNHMITSFESAANAKGVHLTGAIADDAGGPVLTDADHLRRILTVLLDNAIKFTPAGGQVNLQVERVGPMVHFTVSDTGSGIRPEFLPQVFTPFSQATVPSRHSPGGVGIGLAIAQHIVELHNGTIEAESGGEGQGATFTVKLPLLNAVVDD